jgi:hypothetical protein
VIRCAEQITERVEQRLAPPPPASWVLRFFLEVGQEMSLRLPPVKRDPVMPHDAEFARNAWGGDALDDRLSISLRESNGNRRARHHDGRSGGVSYPEPAHP